MRASLAGDWLKNYFAWAGKSFALVFLHQSSSALGAMKPFLSPLNQNGGSIAIALFDTYVIQFT
jgi:hypothetical protein